MKELEDFINTSNSIHNFRYDYSSVKYLGAHVKIDILCHKHGIFTQTPASHQSGNGCPTCGRELTILAKRSIGFDTFKTKCINTHGNLYDYSKVIYINMKTKVSILCQKHGVFEQTPDNHMRGSGCQKCSNSRSGRWSIKNLEKDSDFFKNKRCCTYMLRISDGNEVFYKIGISTNMKFRIKQLKSELVSVKIDNIVEHWSDFWSALELEKILHNEYRVFSFLPKNKFGGFTECFIFDDRQLTEVISRFKQSYDN